jgi:hypothetical protein
VRDITARKRFAISAVCMETDPLTRQARDNAKIPTSQIGRFVFAVDDLIEAMQGNTNLRVIDFSGAKATLF